MSARILVRCLGLISLLGGGPHSFGAVATTAPEPEVLALQVETGQEFELYNINPNLTNETAFEQYLANYANGVNLAKRDWYDCQFPAANYIQKFCCNTAHALGTFVNTAGASTTGSVVSSLVNNAINGDRDTQRPQALCLTYDSNQLCTSWNILNSDKATADEIAAISRYSVQCAQSGGSAEFQTVTAGGGLLYICVSNRATGCDASVG